MTGVIEKTHNKVYNCLTEVIQMDLNSVIYDISGWFTGNDTGTCAMLDDIQEMISEKN